VAQETELGGIEEFIAKNDKNVQVSDIFVNSDEVILSSQDTNNKADKLNADFLGHKL